MIKIGLFILFVSVLIKLSLVGPQLPIGCALFQLGCPSLSKDDYTLSEDSHFDPAFVEVKDMFLDNFLNGNDLGSTLSIYYKGRQVLDLTAGYTDSTKAKLYQRRKLQLVFSTSKVLCVIVIAMLVDRGLMKYEEKVNKYWPEFGQGNKDNVTIGDIMRNFSGLTYFNFDSSFLSYDTLKDLDQLAKIMSEQPHNFDGEKKMCYHFLTYGHLVNELVRRVDPKKRSLHYFIQDEIVKPLDIDLKFILSEKEYEEDLQPINNYPFILYPHFFLKTYIYYPILNLLGKTGTGTNKDPKEYFLPNTFMNVEFLRGVFIYSKFYFSIFVNDYITHSIEFPSFNLKSNAYSLGKLAGLFANKGKLDNVTLLSERTVEEISEEYGVFYDKLLSYDIKRSKGGLCTYSKEYFFGVTGNTTLVGGGGMGGSLIGWNLEKNFAFSYVPNAMAELGLPHDHRPLKMLSKFYEIIENGNIDSDGNR